MKTFAYKIERSAFASDAEKAVNEKHFVALCNLQDGEHTRPFMLYSMRMRAATTLYLPGCAWWN